MVTRPNLVVTEDPLDKDGEIRQMVKVWWYTKGRLTNESQLNLFHGPFYPGLLDNSSTVSSTTDVEKPKCTCDFDTVILSVGCQCGGD